VFIRVFVAKYLPLNPLRKVTRFLLTGLIILLGSLFFLYPQIFYCELIAFSNFKSSDKKVYFSPDINRNKYKTLQSTIALAEARVDSFYRGKKSDPKIIICQTPQQYQKYCSSTEGAGCSIGTPWGSSYVILNAQGMNTDVIAHEMSHIELLKRIGWWRTTNDIPQWFNEGLALMLDRRFVSETARTGTSGATTRATAATCCCSKTFPPCANFSTATKGTS